jgi:hypothetical protein
MVKQRIGLRRLWFFMIILAPILLGYEPSDFTENGTSWVSSSPVIRSFTWIWIR